MKLKILFLCLITTVVIQAKEYNIDLKILNIPQTQNATLSYKNYTTKVYEEIATVKVQNTNIHFVLNDTSPTGIYSIKSARFNLEIIFDKEDVAINTTYLLAKKNIQVLKSDQNKLYYKLINSYSNDLSKRILLTKLLNVYSVYDEFYTLLLKEIEKTGEQKADELKRKILEDNSLDGSILKKLVLQ